MAQQTPQEISLSDDDIKTCHELKEYFQSQEWESGALKDHEGWKAKAKDLIKMLELANDAEGLNAKQIATDNERPIKAANKSFYVIPIRVASGPPKVDGTELKLGFAYLCRQPAKITPLVEILIVVRTK